MVASETISRQDVDAEINYIRNPSPATGDVLRFVTEAEEQSTMETLPGRIVRIRNARSIESHLDHEGFALVPHTSSIVDFDLIQDDPEVDQRYIDEMTELLARVTGASKAFMLGRGKRRYGEGAKEKLAGLSNAKPARYPHADNTDSVGDRSRRDGGRVCGRDRSHGIFALCDVQHVASRIGTTARLSAGGVRCAERDARRRSDGDRHHH